MSQIRVTIASLETCHSGLSLTSRRKSESGMIVIPAASNDPAQAVVVEQAVEAEAVLAVMASKMGLDTSLPRTERLLI